MFVGVVEALALEPDRIAIIGNAGGGKTTLARSIAAKRQVSLTHVDSVQFLPELRRRPVEETEKILRELADEPAWIIDGFGPMDVMKDRFKRADLVIFVDFALWRHFFWASKRQVFARSHPRDELPPGCDEATIGRTLELYRIMLRVHREIRPELIRFFESISTPVVRIQTLNAWTQLSGGSIRT